MIAELEESLGAHRLFVSGLLHDGAETIALISPDEPGFWAHVTAQPEFFDGGPDPLDRWSERVIGALAPRFGARALYPFTGPPWQPFVSWALRSGQSFASPLHLMCHSRMGLWASVRGALALPGLLVLPTPAPETCTNCPAPCTTACPVDALGPDGYDTETCRAHLDTPEGADCRTQGCLARRACPVGESYGRLPSQSAWHMRQFHP
ncbi:MAG: ferredoxin [Thioclava marina]|uniref:ferredoxin n=1 Tax=Thioclava marina TaxID=1915077 RepID=UPI0019CF089E|nr:ferredoxin [Thioclava marina]MBC7145081.1 ferredoxin [Thioclava marina]